MREESNKVKTNVLGRRKILIRSSSDIIHRCESNKSEPSILLLRFALLLIDTAPEARMVRWLMKW
ncbi:hypothetical protein YC2023_082180 [Brassica napus]